MVWFIGPAEHWLRGTASTKSCFRSCAAASFAPTQNYTEWLDPASLTQPQSGFTCQMHWNLNIHSNCFQFLSNPSCCIMLAKLHRLIRTHTISYHFITIWRHKVFPRTVHLKSTRIFTHLAECEELHAKVQQLAKSLNLEEWTNGKNENTSPGTLRSLCECSLFFHQKKPVALIWQGLIANTHCLGICIRG